MNKILLFLLIFPLAIYSQHQFIKIENAKLNNPTYIVNNNVLISYNVFSKLNPKDVVSVDIFKYELSNDEHKNHIPNLSEFGLIQIQTNATFKSKTQNEILKENNLSENSKLYIDGYYIDNPNYKIEMNSIDEIEILTSDVGVILNIWTLSKNERQISIGCSLRKRE